ncbi:MAG: deoxyribodipyrimidine photo-lyase [Oligoflexales bacterium]
MPKLRTAILWIRNDFRLDDNEALCLGTEYDQLIPVFVASDAELPFKRGRASKWWLHHTLESFKKNLGKLDSDLILLKGNAERAVLQLAKDFNAEAILWNRSYNPYESELVGELIERANHMGVKTRACKGNILCEKEFLLKDDGTPYRVYSAFWRNFVKKYEIKVLGRPNHMPPLPPKAKHQSLSLNQLELLPRIKWDAEFPEYWQVGEERAKEKVKAFLQSGVDRYNDLRDQPNKDGTSRLSPHLHFGEIHPQRILQMIVNKFGSLSGLVDMNIIQYSKEILWREFSYHLLQHFPQTTHMPLNLAFENFPDRYDEGFLQAWSKGNTGYPIVDAGMRQLWRTGWMHNRVRMITASFLIKHLGINWQHGAAWFWDTLVDADLASNTQGWQWTAGCGADAAPFFRIFNPITQGEKFDPKGLYAAEWCPELQKIPSKWIYRPWDAPAAELKKAGVQLGADYPFPIVDHREAREKTLETYKNFKEKRKQKKGSSQ